MLRGASSSLDASSALPLDPDRHPYEMTKTDLRDDASLAAMRLERWPLSNWNGGRDAIGIGGRLRRKSAV